MMVNGEQPQDLTGTLGGPGYALQDRSENSTPVDRRERPPHLKPTTMPYNSSSSLWPNKTDSFFRHRPITPLEQTGPHCVSTALAMLSGESPERFQGVVNTQDPVSWSEALKQYGLKLAYCPSDLRRIRFYLPELEALNDLFTLSYYTPEDPSELFRDPDPETGWVCGSHIVLMQGAEIIDPAWGTRMPAKNFRHIDRYVKRIFRVVPCGHARSL
jgi:hypothetical protein